MRYTQPQSGPVQVDWSNPLSKGLVSLLWAGDSKPRDLLSPSIVFTVSGTVTKSAGTNGVGYRLATRSANGIYGPRGNAGGYGKAQIQLPLTLLWIGEVTTDTTGSASFGGVGDGLNGGYIVGGSFGNRKAVIRLGASAVTVGGSVLLTAGQNALALVADGTNAILYESGRRKESVAASGTVNYDVSFGHMGLFGNTPDGALGLPGMAQYQAIWNRALSDDEIKSLSANPWQLFQSPQRVMVAATGGVATYSYTAVGGFVVAGTSPAVRGSVKITTGGLSLSGTTTPAIRGAIKAPTGGLNLSGAALTLRGRVLAGLGGMSFSGAASLVFTSAIQSLTVTPAGGMIIRGTSAMVRTVVRAVSGGITFAGHAATTLTPDPNPPTTHAFKRGRRPRTRKNY